MVPSWFELSSFLLTLAAGTDMVLLWSGNGGVGTRRKGKVKWADSSLRSCHTYGQSLSSAASSQEGLEQCAGPGLGFCLRRAGGWALSLKLLISASCSFSQGHLLLSHNCFLFYAHICVLIKICKYIVLFCVLFT